ncbi:NUDIX hydrolase [Streptomyces cinerochromogenes]|uniref:NUDIX hydrolase n=1 Tax=Streptomyces cinerochromogenes TaxID=66422 RepID=UPI0033B1D8CC
MTEHTAQERPGIAAAIVARDGCVLMVRRRVAEGQLSWQFPAGEIEPGESPEQAAVRETLEEVGMHVTALKLLGERIHPKTGRSMSYVACAVESGTPHVADDEELDEVEWVRHAEIAEFVPYGLFSPVQAYLDAALSQ